MAKVDSIVVKWTDPNDPKKQKEYVVPRSMWNTLDEKVAGDAKVVVNRGGVVADIPADVPFGTFCILVNLQSIK